MRRGPRHYQNNNFVGRNGNPYNRQNNERHFLRNGHNNGGGPARIKFFLADYGNSNCSGRNKPYWMRINVSNGYYRPRNNNNHNSSNRSRGRGSNRRDDNDAQSDSSNDSSSNHSKGNVTGIEGRTKGPVAQFRQLKLTNRVWKTD